MDKEKIKSLLPFLKKQDDSKLNNEKNVQFNKTATNPILQEQLLEYHKNEKKKFSLKDLLR